MLSGQLYRLRKPAGFLVVASLVVILICINSNGCQKKVEKKPSLGKLPYTFATHDTELKHWLQRLKADSSLPYQLDALRGNETPAAESYAGSVTTLLSDSATQVLLRDLKDLFPEGEVNLTKLSRERLEVQLNHYKGKMAKARESLNRPFDPFVWKNTQGLLAESRYVSRSHGLANLEIMSACLALKNDQIDPALESLKYAGKIIRHLTTDQRLISRLTVVEIRYQWLQVVAHLVNHPKCTKEKLESVYQLLRLQMAQWPQEKRIWNADRALGLHTYELVREGKYSSLLSNDEYDELKKQGLEEIRVENVQKNIDSDEVYYLNTFGDILRKMDEPYFENAKWFTDLEKKHEKMRLKNEYPRVALDLLLTDVQNAQFRIAKDRTRCEAWMLALTKSLQKRKLDYKLSPSSGTKYSVSTFQGSINVSGLTGTEFPLPVSCRILIR